MGNNELRLKIITALDNAGIKATKDQIDGLEKQLQKVNNTSGGIEKLEKQLGKLKGPLGGLEKIFGGIGGAIGKVGGVATAVIGAFKTGWDIGTFVNEKIITPLLGIKDPIEELKKSNRQLKKEYEEIAQEIQRKKEVADDAYQNETNKIDQQKEHIDKMTEAWVKTAKAKNAYNNLDLDEDEQQLESNRFAAVLDRNLAGDSVGAEQMNAAYDIQKAMLEAQKKMREQDQEILMLEEKLERREEKRSKLMDQIALAQQRVWTLKKEYKEAEDTGDGATDAKKHQRAIDRAAKRLSRAEAELEKYYNSLEAFDEDRSQEIELETARRKRMLLEQNGMLEVEKAYGKLEVMNERAKRDRAKKEEEAQRFASDYYRKSGQMSEDQQYSDYQRNKRLQRIEEDFNNSLNDLDKWYAQHPEDEDEYNERLGKIMRARERSIQDENDSYYNSLNSYNRQRDEMSINAGRQWEKLEEAINKIPVIQEQYMQGIYNATQQGNNEEGWKQVADALMLLMEAKR